MTGTQTMLFPQRNVEEFVQEIQYLTQEIQELYCADQIPWIVGYSGGKDSSVILQLVWNAIAALPVEKRQKTIYVITTDTLVENPIVSVRVNQSHQQIKETAKKNQMPFSPHLLYPSFKETFWVCLIGKGYPAPRIGFRWCTDRMKIQPVNHFIRDVIRSHGEVILILGTRKAESLQRAKTMEKHAKGRLRERLNPHSSFPNSFVYTPIEDWQTNEVWMYLMQWENPWGGDNKDLLAMYQGATEDNECPLVVDTSTPSCGDSRFGCWVCTMVNKDKSMEAMIQNDEEKEWLQPLLDLRNELDVENDRPKRDFRRIWGKVQLFERNIGDGNTNVEPIPGPYTKESREYWLKQVLSAQETIRQTAPEDMKNITLITQEELSEIRRIWLEEKHEFDDSLPRIYQEITGQEFNDPRLQNELVLLGSEEWKILEELCEDNMHLELMTKLLDTERQYFTKSRRSGIIQELEKCFDTSSRSKNDAIDDAHQKRDLKKAVEQGDFETIRRIIDGETPHNTPIQQPNWGMLKFPDLEEK
jgi:DNA sulfur modification protein DndC